MDLWHLEHRLAQALGMEAAGVSLPPLLKLEMQYVRANRQGIANYALHGPQASGAIEKAMDVTVGRLLKAQGTSWYRLGAHYLLTLRILKQNGGWQRYWQARRSRSPLFCPHSSSSRVLN